MRLAGSDPACGIEVVEARARDYQENGEGCERCERHGSLGAELAPRKTDHGRSSDTTEWLGSLVTAARSMYASTRSSMLSCSIVQAGSWIGSPVRTMNVLWRSAWMASITSWFAGRVLGSLRGPTSRWCDASKCSISLATCTRESASTIR